MSVATPLAVLTRYTTWYLATTSPRLPELCEGRADEWVL